MADDFADGFLDASAPIGLFGADGIIRANLEEAGDRDWFQIQTSLTAGVTYRITLEGKDSNEGLLDDPFLKLFGPQVNPVPILQDNDSGVGRDSYIVYTPTFTFPYFFEVSGSGIGSYEIQVTALDKFT